MAVWAQRIDKHIEKQTTMAKVTYLDNCGFAVKTDNILLVFDYYRDPAHALTHLLKNNPELPVVFFVSNSHPDHFNKEIFKLGQNHKHMYVLANDVLSFAGNTEVQAVGLSAGDRIEDVMGALTIEAFSATDPASPSSSPPPTARPSSTAATSARATTTSKTPARHSAWPHSSPSQRAA